MSILSWGTQDVWAVFCGGGEDGNGMIVMILGGKQEWQEGCVFAAGNINREE